jgi:hypothetical protein
VLLDQATCRAMAARALLQQDVARVLLDQATCRVMAARALLQQDVARVLLDQATCRVMAWHVVWCCGMYIVLQWGMTVVIRCMA